MSELEELHEVFINFLIKEYGINVQITDSVTRFKIIMPKIDGKLFFIDKNNPRNKITNFGLLETACNANPIYEIMFVSYDDNPMITYYHELCMVNSGECVSISAGKIYVIPDFMITGKQWMIDTLFTIERNL